MNKLHNVTRFSAVRPSIDIGRSGFEMNHDHHLTMNAGKLYPVFNDEVLASDTWDIQSAFVNRASTPLKTPVMDTAFQSVWFFYVPFRLVWEHTKEFYGENNVSAWTPPVEYFVPHLHAPEGGFQPDGVADHLGFPTLCSGVSMSALYHRSYRLIWNEWFRDQSVQDPKLVNMGDVENDQTIDELLPVAKFKDYFTTALPEPQKGPAVTLPLVGDLPVLPIAGKYVSGAANAYVEYWMPHFIDGTVSLGVTRGFDGRNRLTAGLAVDEDAGSRQQAVPANLHAQLDKAAAITINDLRLAFAVQSIFEADARCGSRYREFLLAHFGSSVPDLTVSVPEFLGGVTVDLRTNQVVQTSATDQGVSAQGHVTGMSKTVSNGLSVRKSFSEPGIVLGVSAIRTFHSYQQGIPRRFSRRSRFDFFYPELEGIGEQPILNKEIYAYTDEQEREEVFGYQEAFAEYRYAQSYVSGAFRSNYPSGSLDYWTYVSDFDSVPRLSPEFIEESDELVGRTLATTNMEGAPQYLVDFYFTVTAYRPMKAYPSPAVLYRQ